MDCMPEECGGHTDDNGEASEIPTKARFECDREGDVKALANGTIEYQRDCTDETAKDDTDNSLTPNYD